MNKRKLNKRKYIAIILVVLLANYYSACQCRNSKKRDLNTNHTQPDPKSPNNDAATSPQGNAKGLESAQNLAADLGGSAKLAGMYTALAKQVKCKSGANNDPTFVGIAAMKQALRSESSGGNLSKFKKWAGENNWQNFHSEHYDWWMFPLDQNTASKGMKYTVYGDQIEELKKDDNYLRDYRLGAILLMQSWGWDMKNQCFYAQPGNQQNWTDYQVRLGKLAYSLILFRQWDLYQSVEKFVECLKKNKGFVKNDHYVKTSFPNI